MTTLIAPPGKIILRKYTQTTKSGIEVPEAQKGESQLGIVYAFGEHLKNDPRLVLAVGDKVIFKKYVSNALYIPELDDKFDFLEYSDIVAVISEEK